MTTEYRNTIISELNAIRSSSAPLGVRKDAIASFARLKTLANVTGLTNLEKIEIRHFADDLVTNLTQI